MGRKMGNQNELRVVNVRLVKEPSLYSTEKIQSPEDALNVIFDELSTYDREVFAMLNLKSNGQPINFNICSVGTLDSALVSPRECLKSAILSNASSCICLHVHPSGSPQPSREDYEVTRRMMQACDIIGVRLLDHVIVGSGTREIFSFKSEGELDHMIPRQKVWER